MRVDVALVAEAAVALQGKLYIHGGGVTEIEAPVLPWTHPQLAVVVRLAGDAEEADQPHEVALSAVAPDGRVVIPRYVVPLRPSDPPRPPQTERFYNIALTISPITFSEEGMHHVLIEIDNQVAKSLEIPVFRGEGDYELIAETRPTSS